MEEALEFGVERFVFARGGVGGFEFLQGGHESFGDVASTVGAEAAFHRLLLLGSGCGCHDVSSYYAGFLGEEGAGESAIRPGENNRSFDFGDKRSRLRSGQQ